MFGASFPTYQELDRLLTGMPQPGWGEMDRANYMCMLEMFENRMDRAIVRRVGEVVGVRRGPYGGWVAMVGVYYVIHFALSKICVDLGMTHQQWLKIKYETVYPIQAVWDGVSGWRE